MGILNIADLTLGDIAELVNSPLVEELSKADSEPSQLRFNSVIKN